MSTEIYSSKRTLAILLFIWQWKIISTRAVQEKFFSGLKTDWAYIKLLRLKKEKLIETVPLMGDDGYGWILTKKGFEATKEFLPELSENSYKPGNNYHDFLTSCFHLGDWLKGVPADRSLFSEQQVKTYHEDLFPSWAPKTVQFRSDGYWLIKNGNKKTVYSIEVEINRKSNSRYREIGLFYDSTEKVDVVLWLVPSPLTAKNMQKMFLENYLQRVSIHNYILLNDFKKNGWHSKVYLGELSGKKIVSLLSHKGVIKGSQSHHTCDSLKMLDSRKKGDISVTYQRGKKRKKS